jgi:hypothetical protein
VEILPLFRRAVPSRLIMYTYLVAGISLAMWVSARPRWARWVPAAVAAFLLLPSASGSLWTGRVDTPPFFASGQYRRYLSPDETIALIGPRKGAQMLWQAQSGMAFRLVGGYLGSIPADYQGAGLVAKLTTGQAPPSVLRSFLAAHRVGAVVVAGEAVPPRLAAALGVQPLSVGGVELFQLAPAGG